MSHLLDHPSSKHLRAAIAQEFFDFLVPAKEWHTVADLVRYTGMEKSFAHELIQTGKLLAQGYNAAGGEKFTRRIHRTAIIAYLLETASLEPADYVARLCGLIDRLGLTAATLVADHAVKHRNKMVNR